MILEKTKVGISVWGEQQSNWKRGQWKYPKMVPKTSQCRCNGLNFAFVLNFLGQIPNSNSCVGAHMYHILYVFLELLQLRNVSHKAVLLSIHSQNKQRDSVV